MYFKTPGAHTCMLGHYTEVRVQVKATYLEYALFEKLLPETQCDLSCAMIGSYFWHSPDLVLCYAHIQVI